MNHDTIHALVIDRELGELSPEAARLLDIYLEEHPEWDEESTRARQSLRLIRDTVICYPERGHAITGPEAAGKRASSHLPAMAAALALAVGLGALLGVSFGRQHSPVTGPVSAAPEPGAHPSTPGSLPWARYEVRPTDRGYTIFPLASSNPSLHP